MSFGPKNQECIKKRGELRVISPFVSGSNPALGTNMFNSFLASENEAVIF
jgi:hypothetical protein